MIRNVVNSCADYFVKTSAGAYFNRAIYKLYEYLRFRRSLYQHQEAQRSLEALFPDLTVTSGLMVGLKYPSFSSFGSSLFPKLVGTYESELAPTINRLKTTKYEMIIDVGCAEGYYAVGLARMFPGARVVAFDTDESARRLCYEMAMINQVEHRVHVYKECTREWIASLNPAARTLLISDCEGCERHLFDRNCIEALQRTDLIIELHPMYQRDVREYLTDLFKASHRIEYATSYDDKRKMMDLPGHYGSLSELEQLKLVQEGRSFSMDWMIIESVDL